MECEACGFEYSEQWAALWGKTKETDGLGGQPMCVQLVPNEAAPPARDSNGRVSDEPVFQLCRGSLRRITDRQVSAKNDFTFITEGRRL